MKKISIIFLMMFFSMKASAQIEGNMLLGLIQATTAEINAVNNPIEGSLVYNTDDDKVYVYIGSTWALASGINETTTDLIQNTSTGAINYTNETATVQTAQVISNDLNNLVNVGSDGGAYLNITLNSTVIQVDRSSIWAGQVNDPDIHSNGTLTVQETRADTGWSLAAPSTISYTGSPDYVEIDLMAVANNTGNHWAHPHIKVFRNGQEIGEGSGLHMDNSTLYSGRTTTVISMIDSSPGINPTYTFTTLEDDNRTMNNPTIVQLSPVSLVAVSKVNVVTSVTLN